MLTLGAESSPIPSATVAVESVAVPTMVNRAIAEAHAQIAGVPQLTNINTVEQCTGTPTQIFLSTSLPIDLGSCDKYRYLKNIDIRFSNLRISIISKVLISQFNFLFFGYYIPVKFKKHVYYRKHMGNLKV